ncbi:MAG: ATP synthase F0 subunit C [Planctomycetes bacterium]|nr:ATP synthase F0 subunit C [Planctomycetota bacterium]
MGIGLGLLGAGICAGIGALAAGLGISKIAAASNQAIARQPEAGGAIRGNMILTAALIEGVALFACVIAFMIQGQFTDVNKKAAQSPEKFVSGNDK